MNLYTPAWCPRCETHLVDPAASRPPCPVCRGRVTKAAEARVAAMGWQLGGRA